MKTWFAGLCFLVICLSISAQQSSAQSDAVTTVPHFIRFSGATNVEGARVAGVTFALYKEQRGGAPLWEETQNVRLDGSGKYSILLGATKAEGIPADLFTSGEAQWLGVRVEGHPEEARVLLVSVPYAMKAAEAETLSGKPLSAFVLAGPDTKKSGDGLTYLNSSASGTVTPYATSGTTNYISRFVNATDLGNSAMFQSGTKIGLNTTAPLATLHVVSPAGSASGGYFDVYSGASTTAPFVPMFQRTARGTSAAPSATQLNDYLGGFGGAGYTGAAFTNNRAGLFARAAENWTATANGTYMQFITTAAGGAVTKEAMRITHDGKVGIGTTTPANVLDVNGTARFTGLVTFNAAQTFPNTQSRVTGACGPGFYMQSVNANGSVTCGLDVGGGSVSNVSAASGSGLTVTNPTTTPQIGTDFSVIQARLTASCGAGQLLQGINADGSPNCATPAPSVPSGFSILNTSPVVPAGYTANGFVTINGQPAWQVGTGLVDSREAFATGMIGTIIYVAGGAGTSGQLESFNTASSNPAWGTITPSAGSFTARSGVAGATSNLAVATGALYTFGGSTGAAFTNVVEMYDPATNAWTSKGTLPAVAYAACAATDSTTGYIYVIGGYNGSTFLNTVYRYDPVSNTYLPRTAMIGEEEYASCVYYGGKIYVAGGYNGSAVTDTLQIYDIASDTWSLGASMLKNTYGTTASLVNSEIYIQGGDNFVDNELSMLQIYDPATNAWSLGPPTPTPRWGSGSGVGGGKIFLFGGENPLLLTDTVVYNPAVVEFVYTKN